MYELQCINQVFGEYFYIREYFKLKKKTIYHTFVQFEVLFYIQQKLQKLRHKQI